MATIVVGVDGSDNAAAALRWALDNATGDDEVVAVQSWQLPVAAGFEAAPALDPAPFEDSALANLEAAIEEVVTSPEESARIKPRVRSGHSGAVLIEESRDADLLVVGARGHGGFVGLLLGSVTTYVVNHAICPTVVVPIDRD